MRGLVSAPHEGKLQSLYSNADASIAAGRRSGMHKTAEAAGGTAAAPAWTLGRLASEHQAQSGQSSFARYRRTAF